MEEALEKTSKFCPELVNCDLVNWFQNRFRAFCAVRSTWLIHMHLISFLVATEFGKFNYFLILIAGIILFAALVGKYNWSVLF